MIDQGYQPRPVAAPSSPPGNESSVSMINPANLAFILDYIMAVRKGSDINVYPERYRDMHIQEASKWYDKAVEASKS